jgi:hypothetical protein
MPNSATPGQKQNRILKDLPEKEYRRIADHIEPSIFPMERSSMT